MSLPVQLSVGQVSIYGLGSINGIVSDNIQLKYGRVDQMYNQFGNVSVGSSVFYNEKDVEALVNFDNTVYRVINEEKIIYIENPVITPP